MRQIDPKHSVVGDDIVNMSGVAIPEDEPLILFRARDRHALAALEHYQELCWRDNCTDFHMEGIKNRVKAFADFRRDHPDRMKQPGITQGK